MAGCSRSRQALLALPVALAIALQACSTPPSEPAPELSPEQRLLIAQARESLMFEGLLPHHPLGFNALLALLICDDPTSPCTPVTVWGTKSVHHAAGYYIAAQKQGVERDRSGVQASIEIAKAAVAFYDERAATAAAVVRQDKAALEQLKRRSPATEADRVAYASLFRTIEDDRARIGMFSGQLQADIAFLNVEVQGRKLVRKEDTSALEQEREALERISDRMLEQLKALQASFEGLSAS